MKAAYGIKETITIKIKQTTEIINNRFLQTLISSLQSFAKNNPTGNPASKINK